MRLNLNVVGHVPRHWYLVSAGIQYANRMQHEAIQQQDVFGRQKIGQHVGERERSISGCRKMEMSDWGKAVTRN